MTAAAELTHLLSGGDDIPLDRALLLVAAARPGGPDHVGEGLDRLDEIAAGCDERTVEGLVRHLFVAEGFAGDRDDYHDPRNSYLDEVIDRRVGMPITLSAVVLEIGRRIGLDLAGVGMPGHFLVRDTAHEDSFIDPYHDGVQLGASACAARFRSLHGPGAEFHPSYLDPVPTRSIVIRVLNNLTVTFRSRSPRDLDWLLDIRVAIPADPPDLRALADLCELRGRFADAAGLLERMGAMTGSEGADVRARALRARLN